MYVGTARNRVGVHTEYELYKNSLFASWGGEGGWGCKKAQETVMMNIQTALIKAYIQVQGPWHSWHSWWQIVQIILHSAEKSALFIMSAFFLSKRQESKHHAIVHSACSLKMNFFSQCNFNLRRCVGFRYIFSAIILAHNLSKGGN